MDTLDYFRVLWAIFGYFWMFFLLLFSSGYFLVHLATSCYFLVQFLLLHSLVLLGHFRKLCILLGTCRHHLVFFITFEWFFPSFYWNVSLLYWIIQLDFKRASMLGLSLNEDGLLTYSLKCILNFFFTNLNVFGLSKFFQKNIWEIFNLKSCDKDNFHPSRDAALLYIPLHGPHGRHGLIFTWVIEKTVFFTGAAITFLFCFNSCCLLR